MVLVVYRRTYDSFTKYVKIPQIRKPFPENLVNKFIAIPAAYHVN